MKVEILKKHNHGFVQWKKGDIVNVSTELGLELESLKVAKVMDKKGVVKNAQDSESYAEAKAAKTARRGKR